MTLVLLQVCHEACCWALVTHGLPTWLLCCYGSGSTGKSLRCRVNDWVWTWWKQETGSTENVKQHSTSRVMGTLLPGLQESSQGTVSVTLPSRVSDQLVLWLVGAFIRSLWHRLVIALTTITAYMLFHIFELSWECHQNTDIWKCPNRELKLC